jgi:hypothetical protein
MPIASESSIIFEQIVSWSLSLALGKRSKNQIDLGTVYKGCWGFEEQWIIKSQFHKKWAIIKGSLAVSLAIEDIGDYQSKLITLKQ